MNGFTNMYAGIISTSEDVYSISMHFPNSIAGSHDLCVHFT